MRERLSTIIADHPAIPVPGVFFVGVPNIRIGNQGIARHS